MAQRETRRAAAAGRTAGRPARIARFSAGLAVILAAGAVVVSIVAEVAVVPTTGAGAAVRDGPWYVAVGASESVGYQPVPGRHYGRPTDHGYANDLVAMEQRRWPGLRLAEYGCPGITAQGALDGTGRCHYPAGSEVGTAVDFLRAHRAGTVLVTVDLGFNDVWPCLAHRSVDQTCVGAALGRVAKALPEVLADIWSAGGPDLRIVGLEHNDPYLADHLSGPAGAAFSTAAASVLDRLNAELSSIYERAGALVADVPATYGTARTTPVELPGHGAVPYGVARICTLTWMCDAHNLHPDTAGYQVIADAVAMALGTGTVGARRRRRRFDAAYMLHTSSDPHDVSSSAALAVHGATRSIVWASSARC